MGEEQLYVYGFQVVGHTNADANCHTYTDSDRYSYTNAYCYTNGHADTNPNANCYANTDADYRCCGYDQPAAGVDLYFVKRDFYLERGQRDRLFPFRRQLTKWRRYLQFRPSDCALENGK